jgi:hypothetical protein
MATIGKRSCGWQRLAGFSLAVFLVAAPAGAQPVYETRDRAGPVFSDIPTAGATEVVLPPLNRMDSPQEPPLAPAPPGPAVAAYTTLNIVQPANGGTIHSNTGQFAVQLALEPALQTARGDAIAVKLDNTMLPTKRLTLQFEITAEEWQSVAANSAEHQLEVAVVDGSGAALIVAPAVRFYVHRASRK